MSRGVYRDAWGLLRSRRREVVRMAAAAYGSLALIVALLFGLIGWYVVIVLAFLFLMSIFWVEAPLARLVADIREERPRMPIRETFRELYPQMNRISMAGLLAGVGVYAGLYLLVIPGLYLLTRWSMLVPVIVLEDAPMFRAFARSRELVRDHGWRVFGEIVLGAVMLIASWFAALFLVGLVVNVVGVTSEIGQLAVGVVVTALVLSVLTPLICIAWTLRYLALREARPPGGFEVRRLRVADALDEAWALYKKRAAPLLVLGAVIALPVLLARFAAGGIGDWGLLVEIAAALVAYVWLQGLIAEGLSDVETGSGGRWLAALWTRAKSQIPALLVAGIVAGAVFATGIGIVLLIWWSAIGPAIVVERRGVIDSFRRSKQLVSGRVRRVFGVLILSLLFAAVVTVLVSGLLAYPGEGWEYAIAFLATAVTAPWVALAWALMYRQLRLEEPAPPTEPEPAAVA